MGLTGWSREDDEHVKATMGHGRAEQRGGSDDDGEGRREKYNLLHEGFPKLGALFTVVLVCFAQGVGRYI